jgi:hypothetical protein
MNSDRVWMEDDGRGYPDQPESAWSTVSAERETWEVIAGNIGTVYRGCSRQEAEKVFASYCLDSARFLGRVAGEDVFLLFRGEIEQEYFGTLSD